MPMPEPGTTEYEDMVKFMRADLECKMGYSKVEMIARKMLKEQGKDFDEQFDRWKNRKTCVVCKGKVDWERVKEENEGMFMQVDFHGVESLTERQQTVYEGNCCSHECYEKLR
jgi:hypothetical protein